MDRLLELTSLAERSHFWFRGFRAFTEPFIGEALRGVAAPRILDCGCGTGANLEMLRRYGDVRGFDLTWTGLQVARLMGRGPVVQGSVDAAPFRSQAFDLVTCFDVLQCVPDPVERGAVREMRRLLRPGGHAVVNVSALDVLSGSHAALSSEFRRYTPARLRALFEAEGFEVRRISFVFLSLFPMMLAVRLAQRWAGGADVAPGEFDITVPAAPFNAALSAVVRLEALALRAMNMPIGSSVMCLVRKRPDA